MEQGYCAGVAERAIGRAVKKTEKVFVLFEEKAQSAVTGNVWSSLRQGAHTDIQVSRRTSGVQSHAADASRQAAGDMRHLRVYRAARLALRMLRPVWLLLAN